MSIKQTTPLEGSKRSGFVRLVGIILTIAMLVGVTSSVGITTGIAATTETFTDENGISWTVTESYPGWAIKPTNRNDLSGRIIVPQSFNNKSITVIDEEAFYYCTNISEVVLPDTILSVRENAFAESNVKTNIPKNLSEVEYYSFASTVLPEVVNLSNVKWFGGSAFSNCSGGRKVILPPIEVIPEYSFVGMADLKEIVFDSKNKYIGRCAFGSSGLEVIEIPEGILGIEKEAFRRTKNLVTVSLPSTCKYLGDSCFNNCTSLKNINFSEGLERIGNNCFEFNSALERISLPNSIIDICDWAFGNCKNLKYVDFGNACISMGASFCGSSNIETLKLSSNTKFIGAGCFDLRYQNIKRLVVPEQALVGPDAFCNAISDYQNIQIEPSNRNYSVENIQYPLPNDTNIIMGFYKVGGYSGASDTYLVCTGVSQNAVNGYKNKNGHSLEIIVPESINGISVKAIEENAFYRFRGDAVVKLPTSIDKISVDAAILTDMYYTPTKEKYVDEWASIPRFTNSDWYVVERDGRKLLTNVDVTYTDYEDGVCANVFSQNFSDFQEFVDGKPLRKINLIDVEGHSYENEVHIGHIPETVRSISGRIWGTYAVDIVDDSLVVDFSKYDLTNAVFRNFDVGVATDYGYDLNRFADFGVYDVKLKNGDISPTAFYGQPIGKYKVSIIQDSLIKKLNSVFSNFIVYDGIIRSGGSKDAIVTLDTETPNLRVTVPSVLPITVDSDNNVTVADNAQINNMCRGQIDITSAELNTSTWSLVDFNTDFKTVPVNTKQYGFKLYNDDASDGIDANIFSTINGGESLLLSYDGNVAIQSEAKTAEEIGNIVFTVAWHRG